MDTSDESRDWGVVCANAHVGGVIGILYSNKAPVLPLEYHQAGDRIFVVGLAGVEELGEDEGIDGSAP